MPSEAVVVGAGPSGLMAAEIMANAGLSVTVHDKMPSPARKFLMAGRGGLNLTHSEPIDTFLTRYGEAASWLDAPVREFSPDKVRAWADALGQETFVGSSRRVFPASFKASPLLRAWLQRLDSMGVKLNSRSRWTGFSTDGGLVFSDGTNITPDVTVLALGGASWPRLGADGSWTSLLKARNIAITPLVASNAGVMCAWSQVTQQRHAGTPLKRISLSCGVANARGEAMISSAGLEGGAVYALSRTIRAHLDAGKCELILDLRPDLEVAQLIQRLEAVPQKQSLTNRLRKACHLKQHEISIWRDTIERVPDTAEALARSIKNVTIPVTGIQSLDRAISTAGGIHNDEITDQFMLKKLPGVFVCGEMLDWDAPTGGYLLQACFATGAAAGAGAIAFSNKTA